MTQPDWWSPIKGLQRLRTTGRVTDLGRMVAQQGTQGFVGIAYIRWATHGEPSERNAHPHFSEMGARIAVVYTMEL